jgi:rSAM-associated Gly-rich repeat protein
MSSKNRTLKALSLVLPAGAVGASLLLALSAQATNLTAPTTTPQSLVLKPGVAARLKAIRAGVAESANFDSADLLSTWWGNGGWGRWHGGWGNGGFGWHNGGWGNGGWHNGGWGNGGWSNGGWSNGGWGNGWHNFWHNA